SITQTANVNFTPNDGANVLQLLQPGLPSGMQNFITTTFSGIGSGTTHMNDSDGHARTWVYDQNQRVTQTSAWTGTLWLVTSAAWNAQNAIAAETDARGNETDYGYDANGNTLWVQEPLVTTSMGSIRPTARFSYDQFSNLIASCDPNYVAQTGITTCSAVPGTAHYVYDYSDPQEPHGKLVDAYTPLGYQTAYTYDTYGMPLTVTGASITQADGSTLMPTQTFTYNATGTLASYSKGAGTWRLTYDSLNRETSVIDPDPGNPATCTWYNNDGTVAALEAPTQHALLGSGQCNPGSSPGTYASSRVYDVDGNVVSSTVYRGTKNEAAITQNWYDGSDRLVEVQEPYESQLTPGMAPFQQGNENDFYPFPWRTRYLYDISQNAAQGFDGSYFSAHGNLFQTQSYVASATSTPVTAPHWEPINAQAFDALDRPIDKMTTQVCPDQLPARGTGPVLCAPVVEHTVSTYDASGELGLLASTQNPDGTMLQYTAYDSLGRSTTQLQSPPIVPPATTLYRAFVYDADGHPISIANGVGIQTWAYDQDGQVTQTTEPTALQNAATINYGYYQNGLRSSMQLLPSGATPYTQTYDYRSDLRQKTQTFSGDGQNYTFSWAYTNAGRPTAFTSPGGSETYSYDSYGRLSGLTAPGIANDPQINLTSYTYDAAGDKLGFLRVGVSPAFKFDYNLRGELQASTPWWPQQSTVDLSASDQSAPHQSANGHLVIPNSDWDARSGALLGPDPHIALAGTLQPFYGGYKFLGNGSATYDTRGDLSNTTQSGFITWHGQYGAVCSGTQALVASYGYDIENHVVEHSTGAKMTHVGQTGIPCNLTIPFPASLNETYEWGPNGHPVEITDSYGRGSYLTGLQVYEYAHWDGNAVAFTSYNQVPINGSQKSGIDQVLIGDFATYQPSSFPGGSQLAIQFRDESGTILKTGGASTPFVPSCVQNNAGTFPLDIAICQPRTDGYTFGMSLIQGVRAYDPSSGQWTTPDAYAGTATDPMSQQKYMWNNNNPVS
ncbi:MAG: hypothetical protein ACYDA1_09745, partial [Vulcanimicrobiaceae bacterium]